MSGHAMQIAIASGKGGTGKTTIATNLACLAAREGRRIAYVDCDVEEPNGHIFLQPTIATRMPVSAPFPRVDREKCDLCGKCNEICQFSAIVRAGQQILVYPDLCHGCGGCELVCPAAAIAEARYEVGEVERGHAGEIQFARGVLNVGRPRAVPVIKAVKSAPVDADLVILDAPPGTSCPVVETVRGVDFVVLVTEPTPFAFHDLKLAVETMQTMGLSCGVVINRVGSHVEATRAYCRGQGIPVLAEIADDLRLAKACSGGLIAIDVLPNVGPVFRQLLTAVDRAVARNRAGMRGAPSARRVGGSADPATTNTEELARQEVQPPATETVL
jgi:MinD superfamily P-loop ATPase